MKVHCYLFGMTNSGSIVEIDPKQTTYYASPKQSLGPITMQQDGRILEITQERYDIHEFDIDGTPRFIGFPEGMRLLDGFDWMLRTACQKSELSHIKAACKFIGENL